MQLSRTDRRLIVWLIITLLIALVPWFAFSQAKEKFNQFDGYGYTQTVKIGNTLYLSGITGMGPMNESLQLVYERIGMALKQAGADFSHVVKENLYTTDIEAVKANNAVRMKFYKGDYPAATWVQVVRLFNPEYNLEVEVIAVLPEK